MTAFPIVVGVDLSEHAAAAVRWAVEEGRRRHVAVHALLAWSLLDQPHAGDAEFDPQFSADDAAEALEKALTVAVGDVSGIELHTPCDLPLPALLEASRGAAMVVVGARGRGGFPGLLLGSVSDRLVQRAHCPVVVVRQPEVPGRPVVVGVDGSEVSMAALRFGAEAARARGVPLEVVTAWHMPTVTAWAFDDAAAIFTRIEEGSQRTVDEAVAAAGCADLDPAKTIVSGGAAAALIEASERAGLVVVGSRGMGAAAGIFLGSVSRQLVHHAGCPVAVVPAEH